MANDTSNHTMISQLRCCRGKHIGIKPVALCISILFLLSSCESPMEETEPPTGDNTPQQITGKQQVGSHTIKFKVPYYADSPAQARPPDGDFRAGTKVRVVTEMGSYVLVETDSGVQGYVESAAVE